MKRHLRSLSAKLAFIGIVFSPTVFAEIHLSDLPAAEGRRESALSEVLDSQDSIENLGGFNKLLPFVFASPDQEDAGSCLYMAITGIAEWWLARLNPNLSRAADGPLDLSERYIMNVAGMEENDTKLPNWRTDAIALFNRNGHKSLLNSTYRYTKGWFVGETYSEHLKPSQEGAPGARYGTEFNWIDLRPNTADGLVPLPEFAREVLFADPTQNQWDVGVAPDDIVNKVKDALRTREAPILVIYNHNSYWHAVYVIGYNDEMDNGKCAYTEQFRVHIAERAAELDKQVQDATDPVVKEAYRIRAQRAHEAKDKIENAYVAKGGCHSAKGVFYIRDSIYPDEDGPIYDYDLARTGDEAPYAKKIVFKEYDWLLYFANNITLIYPKEPFK